MSDDLVFYPHPMSRVRIVRWTLEEIGHPYRTEPLGHGTAMKSPEFLAINPTGKVPTIQHGDTVITGSPAICAYLANAFPGAGLAPAREDRLRGPYHRWLFLAACPADLAVTSKALGIEIPPGQERMAGCGTLATMLDGLEAAVSAADYLIGDRFSAADLYVGSQLGFGMQSGMIEKRPAFEIYWTRLNSRPA